MNEAIGGVQQLSPAWERISIQPRVDEYDFCDLRIPTPQGIIELSWKKESTGSGQLNLVLPSGITAEVTLPGMPVQIVTHSQDWNL